MQLMDLFDIQKHLGKKDKINIFSLVWHAETSPNLSKILGLGFRVLGLHKDAENSFKGNL